VEFLGPNYGFAAAYEKYRGMIYRHSNKGRIYETATQTEHGTGRFFEIYGEVPTSAQMLFSDSVRYSVETSFYFDTALQNDSLAPVIEFIKQDLRHLQGTIRWKNGWQRPTSPQRCTDSLQNGQLRTTAPLRNSGSPGITG
jgi:hypothetical protein